MNHPFFKAVVLGALLLGGSPPPAHAQSFSVDWFAVAGGGGSSAGGIFSLDGTFGQADANEQPLTGDIFSLTGGFWSLFAPPAPTALVTVLAGPSRGGTVHGSGPFAIGSIVTVTATANSGYAFTNWTEQGTVVSQSPTYSFFLVTNRTLIANFRTNLYVYTVTPSAGSVGFISPGVPQTVAKGGSVSFTASPAGDYLIHQWLVNGKVVQTGGTAYTLRNIVSNASVAVTFAANPYSALTVLIIGNGTVTPSLYGQQLLVGKTYTLTAHPAAGSLFSNWLADGGVVGGTPKLTFAMRRNLALQANFVANPFAPVAGTYQGLFYSSNGVAVRSSGFFSANLTTTGAFSARIQLAPGVSYLSGQFSLTGLFSNSIPLQALGPITAQLQLGLLDSTMTGQISGTNWTADLLANRAPYSTTNPAPQAGRYTLLIPGNADSSLQPGGDGFGAVTVDASGNVSFSGTLGDGTPATAAAVLGGQGQWPFFVPLYSGKGSILGWLTFSNAPDSDISGLLNWIKPAQPGARLYPAGFTNVTGAIGSAYQFTSGVPVLDFSAGQLSLTNGNLSFTNQIILGANNIVTNLSTNNLTLRLATSSGLFTGSVVNPATGSPISISGIVLQKDNFGAGFFLGTNQSGQVLLAPSP
jgi:hypothetical protein